MHEYDKYVADDDYDEHDNNSFDDDFTSSKTPLDTLHVYHKYVGDDDQLYPSLVSTMCLTHCMIMIMMMMFHIRENQLYKSSLNIDHVFDTQLKKISAPRKIS